MVTNSNIAASETRKPSVLDNFLSGDQIWARLRFFVFVILGLSLLVGSFFVRGSPPYLIAPCAAIVAAFTAGVLYLRDIYELGSFWQVFRYLFASFFGIHYPSLSVFGGKKVIKDGNANILDIIGGPGFVYVQPGNAVLFEGLRAPTRILPSGWHFVPRFETIQPIALEEQYGEIEESSAMSRDGFDVKIKHTRFGFQLAADRAPRSRENPYPYSTEAINNMIYNRTVSEEGLGEWYSGVESEIRKVLTGYINRNTLDHLTAPNEDGADPRGAIRRELLSPGVAKKLLAHGARLLWIDIGSFEIPNKLVEQQRLDTWQAKWMGDARVTRSYGEAQRITYQEIGRAEAQAEMVISIMHALEDLNPRGGTHQSMRDMILVRTAQLLEALSGSSQDNTVDSKSAPIEGKKGS